MKRAIYDSLYTINEAFEQIPEHLKKLNELGVITAEYVESQRVHSEELRAGINSMILNRQQSRELEDREHFGKMRETVEVELRSKGPATTL
ncbi:MAG TPA: hypothetical protein VG488_07530 [Candidatus Angelobacter sp.]|jgi:hypothetical protein|nr:hypothetical protein [Candidatus Angelobacter sp.]